MLTSKRKRYLLSSSKEKNGADLIDVVEYLTLFDHKIAFIS